MSIIWVYYFKWKEKKTFWKLRIKFVKFIFLDEVTVNLDKDENFLKVHETCTYIKWTLKQKVDIRV